MLSLATENKLKDLLFELGKGEREIEMVRQKLAVSADFTLISAFERIDRKMDSKITTSDITQFLKENSINTVTELQVDELIKYFAAETPAALNYNEFT